MTLRPEIRTALDEVTPPAPHLRYTALDAAGAARPVRRGRVVKLALPAAAAPLVAALLVVIALIAFRDDGGDHWDRRLTPTGQQMYAMDFLDVDHGWLLAYPERGGPGRLTVYRTQDGGGLWRPVGEVSFGRGDYGTVFGTANRTVRFA